MSSSKMLAAALVAVLAAPAAAQYQARPGEEARRAAGKAPATQPPAAAPAPAPAGQAAAQATGGERRQLTQEQIQALATVMGRNNLSARVGDLAATRATAPELQSIGRTIAEDHRRIEAELDGLVRQRGLTDMTKLPAPADHERLESEFQRLNSATGPEFDQQLVEFLTRNGPMLVESLKRARDVTPGKDAQLKKFLDDAENVEEAHLASFRQEKSKRQARTPPR